MNINVPLNQLETNILKGIFESDLKINYFNHHSIESVLNSSIQTSIEGSELSLNALLCLIDRGYLEGDYYMGSSLPASVYLSDQGFEEAAHIFTSDYDSKLETVGRHLAGFTSEQLDQQDKTQVLEISSSLGMPFLLANHFVDFFRRLGWIKIFLEDTEHAFISYVSPLLRRAVDEK